MFNLLKKKQASSENKTKYDWTDVPHWVNWIHTSESGFAFGSEWKPIAGHLHTGFWHGGGNEILILWPDENSFNYTNWRDSLEQRPQL